ncbi:50S ribosomal protein L29 [Candidatus Babeliales bacterium]|nr:50S ribosomal protein L29 [Candidatus Babeliales bacterium]
MNQVKQELHNSSVQELREKVEGYRRELFSLQLNATTAHVKDYSQFSKLKKNLARALTYLSQKQDKLVQESAETQSIQTK